MPGKPAVGICRRFGGFDGEGLADQFVGFGRLTSARGNHPEQVQRIEMAGFGDKHAVKNALRFHEFAGLQQCQSFAQRRRHIDRRCLGCAVDGELDLSSGDHETG